MSIAKNNADIKSLKKEAADNVRAVEVFEKRLVAMEAKLADLEDRSRRCNVHLVGLKEGAKGTQAAKYLEKSLREWFPSLDAGKVEVMRAHRIYDGRMTRDKLRTLIFNVLRYPTRQAILQAARRSPPTVDNKRLRFYADYSSHTMTRRRAFSQAITMAKKKGAETFLLYPAKLKVKVGSNTREFEDPGEVENFLNQIV